MTGNTASDDKIPVTSHTRSWAPMTAAARAGRFELQVCQTCKAVHYPPRELCGHCFDDDLVWQEQSGTGRVLSHSYLHASLEPYFAARLPWLIGMVKLDCGPVPVVHLAASCTQTGTRVRIVNWLDESDHAVLIAIPEQASIPESATMAVLLGL